MLVGALSLPAVVISRVGIDDVAELVTRRSSRFHAPAMSRAEADAVATRRFGPLLVDVDDLAELVELRVCVEATVRCGLVRNLEVAVPEDAISTDGPICIEPRSTRCACSTPRSPPGRARCALGSCVHHPGLRPRPPVPDRICFRVTAGPAFTAVQSASKLPVRPP